jgi:hypothetical protein
MKTTRFASWFFVAALAQAAVACGSDEDDLNSPATGGAQGGAAGQGAGGDATGGTGTGGNGAGGGSACGANAPSEDVAADVTATATWECGKTYVLKQLVFVKSGATLTIQAGTTIKGDQGSALIVEKGAKIIAEGTKTAPIVFSSNAAQRAPGDWGGVMLNGNAAVNLPGGSGVPEGLESTMVTFGGTDDADSSGVLKYVRIEFAGFQLSPDNELNSLTLNGVGSGTIVEHVQSHFGSDDGFEWFGGTVNVKYLLATGGLDDAFDWDAGWRGKAQFLAAVQDDVNKGDNGFEADNLKDDTTAAPYSEPTISNVTLVGKTVTGSAGNGMLLRRGTKGHIYNALVVGFAKYGLDVDGDQTADNATGNALEIKQSFFANAANFANGAEDDGKDKALNEETWATGLGNATVEASAVGLVGIGIDTVDLSQAVGSPALTGGTPPSDPFFDASATFAGACGASCDEFKGWTAFPIQ